jgi:hypothetical protein
LKKYPGYEIGNYKTEDGKCRHRKYLVFDIIFFQTFPKEKKTEYYSDKIKKGYYCPRHYDILYQKYSKDNLTPGGNITYYFSIVLETPHVIIGAAIATKIGNPALSLPLAFASHFILEKVPHWNPHLGTEKNNFGKVSNKTTIFVTLDSLTALLIGTFIASRALPDTRQAAIVLIACFLSVLPDLMEAPYFFLNMKGKFIERWISIQKSMQENASPLPGVLTQITLITAALWWIFS